MNKAIIKEVKKKIKTINSLYRLQKAFGSVPHDWILKCLCIYKISPTHIQFLTASKDQWKTSLILNHAEGTLYSRQININSGIFQGDSLSLYSPLLQSFCSTILSSQQHQLRLYYKYTYYLSPILHG